MSYLYDAQGRLYARQDRDGKTQYHYEGDRFSAIEDPQGYTTELAYNGLGQLLAITQPESRVTQLQYDNTGQVIGLTDPRNNTTRLLNDDFGHLVSQSHPDTGTSRYRHDPAGNLIAKTDPTGRTTAETGVGTQISLIYGFRLKNTWIEGGRVDRFPDLRGCKRADLFTRSLGSVSLMLWL